MSLQPLGEQVDSDYNQRVNDYNAMLADQAEARGIGYLPLNEAITPNLDGDAPDFNFPIIQTAIDLYLFDKEFIEISESHGLQYLVDNVHLNERGAAIAGDLAAEWLEQIR
jgi:acyl-CoA thioesterase-1